MKTTTTLALACLLGMATANAAVTLTPTQDSDVYEMTGLPTGSIANLGVNSSPEPQPGHSQKSLIQFNLTGISGNDIQSATLRLYVNSPASGFGAFTAGGVSIYSQAASWDTTTLTWTSFSQGSLLGTLNVSNNLAWVEFDATAIAKAWANGTTTNNGFLLQTANGSVTQNTAFASMEAGNLAPQLVITTNASVPEPSALVLVAAGVAGMSFRRRRC